MSQIEWTPLSEYINTEFKGSVISFHMAHKELSRYASTVQRMVDIGEHYIVDGEIVHRKTTAKPCTVGVISIAYKYFRMFKNRVARYEPIEPLEDKIIDNSIRGERYGVDEIKYTFKDGSAIYYRALVNEFYVLKQE